MAELTKFECDITGEVYGAKNAGDGVLEFEIRRHRHSEFEVSKRKIHISNDCLEDCLDSHYVSVPTTIEYIGVEKGEVVGGVFPYRNNNNKMVGSYRERGDVTITKYEPFFELLEEEVIY